MNKKKSSGAQKAENLTNKENAKENKTTKTTKKTSTTKSTPKKSEKKIKTPDKTTKDEKKAIKAQKISERKKAREEKKLKAAQIKAEKKQKRLEKRLEAKQRRLDRISAFKEKMAERREKRRERRDMLKHETKEARIQRKADEKRARMEARNARRQAMLAERQAKREHRLKVRAEKRADRKERQNAPSYGGWLAAVIVLGVTTLTLATMLTFGWISMNGMQANFADFHTSSVYELNSIIDNLDTNLSKARVANSSNEQVKLLTDIAIESEMAEVVLERMPVDTQLTSNITSFVNKMGDSTQSMLFAIAKGKKLTDSQKASLEYMYQRNAEIKKILNDLCSNCTQKDMLNAMKGKDGLITKSFGELENNNIETPKEINDGPFSDSIKKVSPKNLDSLEEISATKAEELAKEYFKDYSVNNVRCTGETMADKLQCYNVSIQTNDGEMFAQLAKKGGKVVMFDSFKDCPNKNFSVDRCLNIAQDFLKTLGYDGMKGVWTSENGTTCNLNFVYEQNGVILYPDMVKVKVCEERGIVTGLDSLAYVLNHTDRKLTKATISEEQAKEKINAEFASEGSRLTLIPFEDSEVLAYEFFGTYKNNQYYIYVDAKTGEELQTLTVIGTAQGRALM